MREILDALPEEQRVAVTMFYYEQMSVKEIAETLGVTENTVKSRLNYGRKKVEKEVRALEKKGTKLYGLAPLPFLMLLFHSQEASAAGAAATHDEFIHALGNCRSNGYSHFRCSGFSGRHGNCRSSEYSHDRRGSSFSRHRGTGGRDRSKNCR